MKSKLLLLTIPILAFLACNYVENNTEEEIEISIVKTDLQKQNLSGEIKSIEEINYYADLEAEDSIGRLSSRKNTKYNSIGNMEEIVSYGSEDYLIYRIEYDFNKNGVLMEAINYNYDDEFQSRHLYTYDENENLMQISVMDEFDKNVSNILYEYDVNGNATEVVFIDVSSEDIMTRQSSKYDDDGRRIEHIFEDLGIDYYHTRTTFEYNEEGDWISTKTYNENDTVLYEITYSLLYDVNGNWIKRYTYNRGRLTHISFREIKY